MYPPGGGGTYPPGGGVQYTPPPGSTYRPPGTTPGGSKYPGVIPGSQKERDLDAGRTHHPEMYDQNDAWVGAEGTEGGVGTRSAGGYSQGSGGGITGDYSANRTWDNPNTQPGTDFFGGGVTAPAGTDFFGNGNVTGTHPGWGAGVTPMPLAHLSTYPGQNTQNFNTNPSTNIPSYNTGIQNVSNNTGAVPYSAWNELIDTQNKTSYTDAPSGTTGIMDVNWDPMMSSGSSAITSASKPTFDLTGFLASQDDETQRNWATMSNAQQQAQLDAMISANSGANTAGEVGMDETGWTDTSGYGVG